MIQKTDLEVEKTAALKAIRSNIRLKYSLMADEEINRVLPEWERRIDTALQDGQPLALDVASIIAGTE